MVLDTSALGIVNRVIDTLDLRISRNRQPSSWLLQQAAGWRVARDAWEPGSDPVMVKLGALGTFRLLGSSRPFEFVLVHPEIADIRIWNPDRWDSAVGSQTGQIMVNFRSKFLQLLGIAAVKNVLRQLESLLIAPRGWGARRAPGAARASGVLRAPGAARGFGGRRPPGAARGPYIGQAPRPDFCRVARGDLAVDVHQSAGLSWADLETFVCQTRNSDVFTTLSDLSRKRLLESVLDDGKGDAPPMGNKGVSLYMRGPLEAAAATLLDAYAAEVREEVEEGRRGARVTRSVLQGRTPQTVYFGRYTSPIFAKVYNKLASLRPQKKLYMLDVWADQGWDKSGQVWRWEWTFTGDFLKSVYIEDERVDIRELDTFLAYIPALWAYVSFKWLRQVVKDTDVNVTRQRSTLYWALVQTAWQSEVAVKRDHSREIRCKDDKDKERRIDELDAQARGCMVSASALRASRVTDDFKTASGELVDTSTGEVLSVRALVLADVDLWMDEDFDDDVHHRRRFIGVDDLSDCALTSLQRAVRMAEGRGS